MSASTTQNSRNVARAIAFGSLVLSIFCILLGLILFVTGPLQYNQDIRQRAMTPVGTAQLDFSPAPGANFASAEAGSFDIKLIPYTVQPNKITFVFDLITHETIDVTDVILNPYTDIRKELLEFKKVDHGYTVTFIGQYPDGSAHSSNPNTSQTILTVKFQQKKAGKLQVNFDRERSKLIAVNNGQQSDELRTADNFEYTIAAPPAAVGDGLDDLYFKSLDSSNTILRFFNPGTSTEVSANALEPGKQYEVEHTAAIQNTKKSTDAPATQVAVQLKVNDQTFLRKTLDYKSLSSKTDGEQVGIRGVFTAAQKNTFVISIDPDNVYPEKREDNNAWQTTTEFSSSLHQCNDTCNTNSDCKADQRCYDTGSDKRCRLVTNVTSTSCSPAPDQGLRRSCNQYCADTRECAAGLTCWYNQCRLLQNLESKSCRMPQAVSSSGTSTTKGGLTTTGTSQPITYQSCNESCKSNRECAAGLRCYQGSCRNPLAVASTSCSLTAEPTASATPIPTATPKPTASPTAKPTATPKPTVTSSPKPTAKPSASPRPTPAPTPKPILSRQDATGSATVSPTASPSAAPLTTIEPTPIATAQAETSPTTGASLPSLDSVLTSLAGLSSTVGTLWQQVSNTFQQNPEIYGIATPYLVIGAGAVFLLIAILLLLFGRKRSPTIPTAAELAQQSTGAPIPQKNPLPPKEVLQRRVTPDVSLIKSVVQKPATPLPTAPQPVVPQPPKPMIPVAPLQPQTPTATRPDLSAMIRDLKQKQQVAASTPAQTPVTNPPTSIQPQKPEEKLSMADRLKQKGVTISTNKSE